jgi:hypothetical protein
MRKLLFSFFIFAAGLIGFSTCSVSVAQSQDSQVAQSQNSYLENENLLVTMPQSFKMGFQSSQGAMKMQEWVRLNETVDNWSELITVQIIYGKNYDPSQFLRAIGERWLTACPGSKPYSIYSGQTNGYKVSMTFLSCPLNSKSGKPEYTQFRAIQGKDSFYTVQWATGFVPSKEQAGSVAKFLDTVNVCDTRTAEHPCPDLKAQGFTKIE